MGSKLFCIFEPLAGSSERTFLFSGPGSKKIEEATLVGNSSIRFNSQFDAMMDDGLSPAPEKVDRVPIWQNIKKILKPCGPAEIFIAKLAAGDLEVAASLSDEVAIGYDFVIYCMRKDSKSIWIDRTDWDFADAVRGAMVKFQAQNRFDADAAAQTLNNLKILAGGYLSKAHRRMLWHVWKYTLEELVGLLEFHPKHSATFAEARRVFQECGRLGYE